MKAVFNRAVIAAAVSVLVACGGGGGGGGNDDVVLSPDNPLAKYNGTYYVCDGHSKETITFTAVGEESANVTSVEDIYSGDNCSGSIVGTYRLPRPLIVTYEAQTAVTMPPITLLPFSAIVDRLTLNSPRMTAELTGSGVRGNCVEYIGGNVCYDSLSLPAVTTTGAIYQTGNYLVTFSLENGVLEADGMYSKDPSFNYAQLVLD